MVIKNYFKRCKVRLQKEHCTETMAYIYSEQGYLNKAVEIFRFLETQTDDKKYAKIIEQLEEKIVTSEIKYSNLDNELIPLLESWVRLLLIGNTFNGLRTKVVNAII